jgi:phenylalanyl-tRNA synthetase alpha chain
MTTSLTELETQLTTLKQAATTAISAIQTLSDLEDLRVAYFGKKGELSQILRGMGKLGPEEKPRIGALANEVKEALQNQLDQQRQHLQTAQIQAKLAAETLDVTMPGVSRSLGHIHPLNGMIDSILDIFVGLGYTVAEGPQIETDYYNFEALNTPPDHPARDMQDTFYLPVEIYYEPILHRCKFVTWKPMNLLFVLLHLVAFIVEIQWTQLTRPSSIKWNY